MSQKRNLFHITAVFHAVLMMTGILNI